MRNLGALIFSGFELLDLFGLLSDEFDLRLVAETLDQWPATNRSARSPI